MINAVGLSTALACVIIIFLYVRHESSFDRFQAKANRFYLVTTDSSFFEIFDFNVLTGNRENAFVKPRWLECRILRSEETKSRLAGAGRGFWN